MQLRSFSRVRRPASRGCRPIHGAEGGQALLELALVAPILVLILMGIFQFAYVFESQVGLTNAVREAARRASTAAAATTGDMNTFLSSQLDGGSGLLAQNVQAFNSTRATTTVAYCTYGTSPQYGTSLQQVTITVSYAHPVFFPLLSYATDAFDGNPGDNAWTLNASAQMKLEHPFGSAPGACA